MRVQSPTTRQSSPAALDADLVFRVKEQTQALEDRGAKNGARRLNEVLLRFDYYTVEGAAQYIRKDEIIDEMEGQPHKLLSTLRLLRNVLSVTPIVLTWFALFGAATAYESDLATAPNDIYQPFLLLWQEGFHGKLQWPFLIFSSAAVADFWLLLGLVILVILIPISERWHLNRLHASLTDFDVVIDDLLAEIGQSGVDAHLADSDVAKLSTIIKDAIEQTLGHLMLKYNQVAENALKHVESANESTKLLVKNFDDNLVIFNSDVKLLTDDLKKVDQNIDGYGQRLQELSEASGKLAGSSNDLASNAKSLADSANLNVQASQGISARLSDLNVAQQEIIKTQKEVAQELATTQRQVVNDVTTSQQNVVQKIADSQREVVTELTGAAGVVESSGKNTRDAASNLERVAVSLEQLTRADFQSMTDGVKKANQDLVDEVRKTSIEVQHVVQGLSQVGMQLQQTTRELNDAALALKAAPAKAQSPAGVFASKVIYLIVSSGALIVIGELALLAMRMH